MVDNLTIEQRHRCMSNVRNKNTSPELKLRRALWIAGLRYRIKSNLPGDPDIVFPKKKLAIFVDGCFWHGCPIHGSSPKTNVDFWESKIQKNIQRDQLITHKLELEGWLVIRVWEHELKNNLDTIVEDIKNVMLSSGRL